MSEISATQKFEIGAYSFMNYDNSEIAEAVGVSRSTVSTYLNQYEDRAKEADNPLNVFWEVTMGGVFDESFARKAGRMFMDM